jgi:hypothetical protein
MSAATGSVIDLGGVRTRNTVVTRGISALAAVAIALALGGSLVGGGESGPLGWSGDARVFQHPTLPGDRVLTGTLRNDGDRGVRVDIGAVRVVTADGMPVPSTPVFLKLWPPDRGPFQVADSELQRTGSVAALEPGEEVPLTVAWRAADGRPARVEWGGGSVPIP